MKAIDNSAALNYCANSKNSLNASLAFALVIGALYTSAPTVAFSGGGGTGAAGTAVLTNGRVTGVTITNAGSGYTSAPTIAFSGGGGTGAAALAVLTGATIGSITITNGGPSRTLTVTDNTVYPAGDSRAKVNILVADRFGKHKEYPISSGSASVAIDLAAGGFKEVDGIDMEATVVSVKGMRKNGSVHDVNVLKTSGNFVMDI